MLYTCELVNCTTASKEQGTINDYQVLLWNGSLAKALRSPVRDCFLCAYGSLEALAQVSPIRRKSDFISSDQSITIRGCSPKPQGEGYYSFDSILI